MSRSADPADPAELERAASALCRELIRVDTSNPPGNETAAAHVLAEYLGAAGVDCELAGPDPGRLNLIARIEGRGDEPSLMLMGHTDVVPAAPEKWSVPPFAGELRDGHVIGRGAADMKGELAARAVAFATFARSGEVPAGDLVLLAEADEEDNTAGVGVPWLVEERPDIACDFALNEGGGEMMGLADGGRVLTISIGEKIVSSITIRVSGRGGHASVPGALAEGAVGRAARAIELLNAQVAPAKPPPQVLEALSRLGAPGLEAGGMRAAGLFAWASSRHERLGELVPAMSRLTVTPTGVHSHEPANVMPPWVEIVCDCRALPGQGEGDITEHVARALTGLGGGWELEFREPLTGGTLSEQAAPLWGVCERFAAERAGAELLPVVSPGFSDSYWMRTRFGTVAYGFAPIIHTGLDRYLDGKHAADESIAAADLGEIALLSYLALREHSRRSR